MKYNEALNEYIKEAGWRESIMTKLPAIFKRAPQVAKTIAMPNISTTIPKSKGLVFLRHGNETTSFGNRLTNYKNIPGKVGGGLRTGQTPRKGAPYNPYKENVGPSISQEQPQAEGGIASKMGIFKRHPLMTGAGAAYAAYMLGQNQGKKRQQIDNSIYQQE